MTQRIYGKLLGIFDAEVDLYIYMEDAKNNIIPVAKMNLMPEFAVVLIATLSDVGLLDCVMCQDISEELLQKLNRSGVKTQLCQTILDSQPN